ncbi:hypothetical protein [Flavobacterium urocaniciphilum]|uniref:Uncharacterized protein n=1 Tax=Flavobacterium urocaniciphilum TaxID=1299341 RepID=A0A1H9DL31_9FLAO|nr:hypothetical protein [Flavobacterium urocaniciphilum]SEQ14206.1 hypothetical protein SAMN05444005_107104 [Flavobacterium urocaniciphilum]
MLNKVRSWKLEVGSKVLFSTIAFCLLPFASIAQCAMCRASLQNEANKAAAEGVNDGIVYLMAIPYILVAAVFYAVWRLRQKKKEATNQQ